MTNIYRLLILLLILLLPAACSDVNSKTMEETKRVSVEVIKVKKHAREELLKLLGTVEADREMKVGFKIGGKIKTLAFREGKRVKKHNVLARLDTTELLAEREKARENKKKAKRDMRRMERLFKDNIIPLSSLQDARSLYVSAGAELKIVEDHLKNSYITAPFSGRITKKLAEVGEIVGPSTPVAILTEMDPILVMAAVPDNIIRKITIGRKVHVKVDSCPDEKFEGVIKRLETTADTFSRTFRMEVRLSNPDEKLRPGLIAQVEITYGDSAPGIFIPLDAVIGFGADPAVFVVNELSAERRPVKLGRISGEDVEIREGLVQDEILVISGQEYLKDGQAVLIVGKGSEKK